MASDGHVTFNSNAVLPVSDSGVKYGILFSGNISRWLLLVMCPLTAMQSYLFLNLVLNMLFVQQEHIEVTSVDHVTCNSNAVLPVSESGVKICYLFSGNISR